MNTVSWVRLTPMDVTLNGRVISTSSLNGLYREFVGDYPKFFKMDSLCKLGFIGAELLLKEIAPEDKKRGAVILFNTNGSLVTDRNYQKTIEDGSYFPSPALFVYTLANIVTGEISIRHKIYGETSFHVMQSQDLDVMEEIVENVFLTSSPSFVLAGWVDYNDDSDYLADLRLLTK